ncbi:MAG: thymidylate kinase [Terracidiphilus sp.]
MLTRFRQAAAHALFKGDQGIGAPFAPINRRDKNVRSWLMTVVRLFLYTLDAVSARTAVKRALRSGADVVVFDRFIHDELANLNLRNPIMRAYVRLAANVASRPHISYLLDADPIQARARKPEYPIDFLYWSRQAYLVLGGLIGGLTVIEPMPTEETAQWVFGHIYKELSLRDSSAHPGVPACKRFIGGILPGGERSRPDAF